jgi:hypothetical protein
LDLCDIPDEPVLLPLHRRPVVTALFEDLHPHVLSYALEEILAEKLRSILQRGKARDYYDVWRLLREKADAFDQQIARRVLSEKCSLSCAGQAQGHKGLPEPSVKAFLSPAVLEEAAAYWSQELMGQVQGKALPVWDAVTAELGQLLDDFFSG